MKVCGRTKCLTCVDKCVLEMAALLLLSVAHTGDSDQ